jgi:hypothetical protein
VHRLPDAKHAPQVGRQPVPSLAQEPTGQLALTLTSLESGLGVRAIWKDGKRQRLEDCLEEFVASLSTPWRSS